MKKAPRHKVTIRQKEGADGLMTGMNTEVLLDGKLLKGVTSVHFGVDARGAATLQLSMFAKVELEGEMEVVEVQELTPTSEPETAWCFAELPKPIPYDPNYVADPRAGNRPDPNAWVKD